MSGRKSTGSDTALVKAMVAARKAWNGRGNKSVAQANADLIAVRKARSTRSGLPEIASSGKFVLKAVRRHYKALARIDRRVRKKLGQPYRKNMNRKAMHQRAAGKNEVRP